MGYYVAASGSLSGLEQIVTYKLNEGWECQGGVSAFWNSAGWVYHQALVKK